MKKSVLIVAMFACILNFANGQGLADNYLKGSIYLNDGQVIEGYLYYNILNPEQFQKSVSYITEVVYQSAKATDKLKSKDIQEVKAKEAKYFQLADGRKFVTMKFADMSAAGAASIPSYYFFEEIVSGKISLYRRYVTDGVAFGVSTEEAKAWILANYQLLIVTAEKGVKSISNIAVPDYIADNSEVLAKFNADKYGNLKAVFSRKIKIGDIRHPEYEKDFILLLSDYNK